MNTIVNLPNLLSLCRLPLACCLLIHSVEVRLTTIFLAMITDILDGFLARRYAQTTRAGTILDPVTDKFFVMAALAIFFYAERLNGFELVSFLCRDLALLFFSAYLFATDGWKRFTIRSFYLGKIVTSLQFMTLLTIAVEKRPPFFIYALMALCGVCSFIELLFINRRYAIDNKFRSEI